MHCHSVAAGCRTLREEPVSFLLLIAARCRTPHDWPKTQAGQTSVRTSCSSKNLFQFLAHYRCYCCHVRRYAGDYPPAEFRDVSYACLWEGQLVQEEKIAVISSFQNVSGKQSQCRVAEERTETSCGHTASHGDAGDRCGGSSVRIWCMRDKAMDPADRRRRRTPPADPADCCTASTAVATAHPSPHPPGNRSF